MTVCKGFAVQKSLETLNSRRELGGCGAEAPDDRVQGAAK